MLRKSALGVPAYEVTELPKTSNLGDIVIKDDITYVYHNEWKAVEDPFFQLKRVKEIVRNADDCKLKDDLAKVLLDFNEKTP